MRSSHASALALAAVAALSLTACGSGSDAASESASDGALSTITSGTLTVCTNPPYEPFEYQENGTTVGFDMDLAQAVADDAGLKLNILNVGFETMDSGIALATQCDIAASGITINDTRKAKMDFSTPYLDDDLVLLANKNSGVASIDDAKNGKKVGVQQATTGETWAKANGITPVSFKDVGLQIQAVAAGTNDAALGNQSVLLFAAKDNADLVKVADIPTGEKLGIAVKKDNTPMLEAVNKTLKRLEDSGEMLKLKQKYFGDDVK
ncbi:MAG: ABC transporter substrate-binding protein [Arthrobacter sp.]|jgi:polar amino acid transport system substrate-binding protein|nr:ABC transporter substrate-binding protein [Arthrobacter sp.]